MTRSPLWEFLVAPSAFGDPSRTAVSASGVHVTMADGARLLCGTSGLWNVNFGYGRPEITRAVTAALEQASYLPLFRCAHAPALAAAQALLDACGSAHFARVLFSTSGSAANDVVMKLARHWAQLGGERGRKLVVGLRGSYHGLTYGSFSLTGEELGQDVYGVDRRFVRHVDPFDPAELRALCEREGSRIAALVLEPVLGSGALAVPDAVIAEAGRLADEHGFLLVADEVATGFHRTGPLTASGAWLRRPDVLVLSKGLTNGTCAAAALLVADRVCEAFDRADSAFVHGETQAGSPTSAAAILATLDVAAAEAAAGAPQRVATRLDGALRALAAERPELALSGVGCFRGVRVGHGLDGAGVTALVDAVRRSGAIVQPGPGGVQLVPAVTYTDAQVDALVQALADGLDRFAARGHEAALAVAP